MKCPRCQQDNPIPDAQFCPRCGAPVKHAEESGPPAPSYAEVTGALREAVEREQATAEILRAISGAQIDTQPVFGAIVENAARLCDGLFSTLATFDGERLHLVATHNWAPAALPFTQRLSSTP